MTLQKDSEIKLAKVDGTVESSLIKTMKVSGYPTLFFYREGEYIRWELSMFAVLCWILFPKIVLRRKYLKHHLAVDGVVYRYSATIGEHFNARTVLTVLEQ